MSSVYYEPDNFILLSGEDAMTTYQWGDRDVYHRFCKTCGIYPFHDGPANPGQCRVNLGCVDEVDPFTLNIELINGKDF